MRQVAVVLIMLGILLLLKFPIAKLPGDFVIQRGNLRLYLPIMTCIILSIILSLILRLLGR